MQARRYRNLKGCAHKTHFQSVSSAKEKRNQILIIPAFWEVVGAWTRCVPVQMKELPAAHTGQGWWWQQHCCHVPSSGQAGRAVLALFASGYFFFIAVCLKYIIRQPWKNTECFSRLQGIETIICVQQETDSDSFPGSRGSYTVLPAHTNPCLGFLVGGKLHLRYH